MHTIKKYANRKLYNTNRKQYITLEGIASLIQNGEQIQVLDNETGEDITASILTQVVLQTRDTGERLPTHVLTGLIRTGSHTLTGVRRSLWAAIGGASTIDAEIRRRLDRLQAEGKIDPDDQRRMEDLLLYNQPDESALADEVPSRHDITRLHAQVDALAAAVDQLLSERDQRASTED
jgi:polyhydroxyalkanoate synthesis repressor PhaR